ncbi:phage regulatory CII family protein [Acinetobacter bereziniae]|uniref:phage regulatory CII family protein n=1 Tax=Acinetobacter bereziniae TaxID=106648 RepID=UPI0012500F75|nr:phage regulatory CII family protein [Acinetobacter bereziniae]MBJ9902045.1 XRE family transcriptional regulator [Acinetobacter bereziniae]MCU4317932.1 XRE family transcriptional regulator [Acinetobacter bereziniae]MCU4597746.1 XRE family transcriptional regulator [Acinetobacter bereziniae]
MDISKETKTALHKMIHHSTGISPKDVADVLGVSHKTVLNYANPNMDMHLPSLKAFESALVYTQNPANLKVWAHMLGFMLVPVNNADGKEHHLSVLESLLGANINVGQVNKQVHDVMADGVVTPNEMEETDQILEQLELNVRALRQAMKTECAKYLSALQIEKA